MQVPSTEHNGSKTHAPSYALRRKVRLSALLLLGSSAVATAASAQGSESSSVHNGAPTAGPNEPATVEPAVSAAEAKKKAKEHFETGLRLYEDGDYSLALIEFERAYSYIPDFRVLYNIGQVSIQLGRYARASQALEQYLKDGGPKVNQARVTAVHGDLKMLEGRTAHLMVKSNVEGADVLLDNSLLGKTPISEPVLVDAGEHRITLKKDGFVTHTEPLVLAGRDDSSLQIDLAEEVRAQPVPNHPTTMLPPTQPPVFLPQGPPPRKNDLLYVGWGATGLLAVGWAVTGIVGIKAASNLHNELNQPTTVDQLDALKVKARGWLLASDNLGAAT